MSISLSFLCLFFLSLSCFVTIYACNNVLFVLIKLSIGVYLSIWSFISSQNLYCSYIPFLSIRLSFFSVLSLESALSIPPKSWRPFFHVCDKKNLTQRWPKNQNKNFALNFGQQLWMNARQGIAVTRTWTANLLESIRLVNSYFR